ncbi:hypothetical protein CCR75_006577 [Bremia lactucae]|uniref:Uncharacterized protein n=1 Tax=Bremia lactucae TaxID=4779 RepID=A0A976FH29_BRELC|nr:hypothetical protein CCR75_006577 [Bremia lactucae]
MVEPPSTVQKLKLQLFHRLQRQSVDAWKSYWQSFQLFMLAQMSLSEFHELIEELLGPHKYLHNNFVIALLSSAHQCADDDMQRHSPHRASALHEYNSEGKDKVHTVFNGGKTLACSETLPLQIKEEREYNKTEATIAASATTNLDNLVGKDLNRRLQQDLLKTPRSKRLHNCVDTTSGNREEEGNNVRAIVAVTKLLRLSQDESRHDQSDQLSAELLMGLGKRSATSTSISARNRDIDRASMSLSSSQK